MSPNSPYETLNQTYGIPGRGGGVRKTYIKKILAQSLTPVSYLFFYIIQCPTVFYWTDADSTVSIWIPDKSGIKMVQTCPVIKRSDFQMVVWKLDKKYVFCLKCLDFEWSALPLGQTFWKLNRKVFEKSNVQNSGIRYWEVTVFYWRDSDFTRPPNFELCGWLKYSSSGFFRSLAMKPSGILRVLGLEAFFCLVTYLLPMVGRYRIVCTYPSSCS